MGTKKVTFMIAEEAYKFIEKLPAKSRGAFISGCVLYVIKQAGSPEAAFMKSMMTLIDHGSSEQKHNTPATQQQEPEDDLGLDPRAIAGELSDDKKDDQEENFEPEIKFDL